MTSTNAAPTASGDAVIPVPPEMAEALAVVVRIGGNELLDRIVTLFHQGVVERLTKARAAADAGDLTSVRRLAHAVKGSAAQVGAEALRAAAGELEKSAESMSPIAARDAVTALDAQFAAAYAQLDSARRNGVTA